MSDSESLSVLQAFGLDWNDVPTLYPNEWVALDKALALVLSEVPKLNSLVVMALFERGFINLKVWEPFEHFSHGDVVNTIWQFQEAIREAIVESAEIGA